MLLIQILDHIADQRQRVAKVGLIAAEKHLFLFVDHHHFNGGRAAVDANMHRAAVFVKGSAGHAGLFMASVEFFVFLLIFKQRRLAGIGGLAAIVFQPLHHIAQRKALVGIHGGAHGHKQKAVFGANAGGVQRFVKALAQNRAEGERPAQIQHLAPNGAALCQAGNGLVYHGFINRSSHILGACALIDQRLDIAFGKHAAAAGDGVGALCLLGSLVHFLGAHFQQGGHLVNKSARAACAAAVHAHFGAVGEKQDFGILAAQLDHAVGAGHQLVHGHTGGKHFLHKGHAAAFGQAHTRRAGNGQLDSLPLNIFLFHTLQKLFGLFQNMAEMSFVCTVQNTVVFVQHYTLDGGRTDI